MELKMEVDIFWVVALCIGAVGNQRFGGCVSLIFRVEVRGQGNEATAF